MNNTTRRELLIVASLGGVAATAGMVEASARGTALSDLNAKRQFHTKWLSDSMEAYGGVDVLSRTGMEKSIALLKQYKAIDDAEESILGQLVSSLFDVENLDTLLSNVQDIINAGASRLSETVESIAAVIQSSVEYAADKLSDIDYAIVRTAIAHDVQGALLGVAAGASLHSSLAAIGAILGGVSGSVIGYDKAIRSDKSGN